MYNGQTIVYVVCIMTGYILWLRDYLKNKNK